MTQTVDDVFKLVSVPLEDSHKNRLLLFAMSGLEVCADTLQVLLPHLPESTKPVEVASVIRTLRGETAEE